MDYGIDECVEKGVAGKKDGQPCNKINGKEREMGDVRKSRGGGSEFKQVGQLLREFWRSIHLA